MARFLTLASSSAGNSYFAGSAGGGLLIDAGISARAIVSGLENAGFPPEKLGGILITHEHVDHIRGLGVFLKKYHIPVYASGPVGIYLAEHGLVPPGSDLREIDEHGELISGMLIAPFHTSHDSVCSLGYRISTSDDRRITIATDTGYITDQAREHLLGSDLVLIESNYELSVLDNGRYPYYLKRRIKSSVGHLSNDDCAAILPELVRSGTTRILLAHLSNENNLPALAREASSSSLSLAGMRDGSDYMLSVAPRSENSPLTVF